MFPIPPAVIPTARTFMWDQWWAMFAPQPPSTWFWLNIEAELENGTKAELFSNGAWYRGDYNIPHTFDKPRDDGIDDGQRLSWRNHRWFKFMENGYLGGSSNPIRLSWGKWLCRQYIYKEPLGVRVKRWKMHFMGERLKPNNGTHPVREPNGKSMLWDHTCYT